MNALLHNEAWPDIGIKLIFQKKKAKKLEKER